MALALLDGGGNAEAVGPLVSKKIIMGKIRT